MKKKILIGMGIGAGMLYLYSKKNPDMIQDMKKNIKDTCETIADIME